VEQGSVEEGKIEEGKGRRACRVEEDKERRAVKEGRVRRPR
jgi:hypothetical protein